MRLDALLAFAGIAVFVGAFVIQNTFRITVAQRVRELALLRAVGATGSQVTRLVLVEALIVAVVASAVGVLAGIGVAELIKTGMDTAGLSIPDGPLTVAPRTIAVHSLGSSPGFPVPRTGCRRPAARTRAGNETARSGFRIYSRTVPSRSDPVPPGKDTAESFATAAHPESVARISPTLPSRTASSPTYGRTDPGSTSGTLPAVKAPHSAATAHARGSSLPRKEASPRDATSSAPERAGTAGPAASPT